MFLLADDANLTVVADHRCFEVSWENLRATFTMDADDFFADQQVRHFAYDCPTQKPRTRRDRTAECCRVVLWRRRRRGFLPSVSNDNVFPHDGVVSFSSAGGTTVLRTTCCTKHH